jgi:alpha-mannosidase
VPVFWGLGNHGGGATRRDLEAIDAFMARETRVRIVHSTPDQFYDTVEDAAASAPIIDGDLQHVFTGCYTSLSRLKRQAVASLGRLVQAETASAAASWLAGAPFPGPELREVWNLHLFNDFHDILPGSCIEPAERDALGQYGRAEDIGRSTALAAVASLNRGSHDSPPLPVTIFNANPSLGRVPVEFECMADHRPFWKGKWRMRLFRADGREVACQEEQPESLLPFNNWRRRISFVDDLAGVGVSRYHLKAFEIPAKKAGSEKERGHVRGVHVPDSWPLAHRIDPKTGLVASLVPSGFARSLAGPVFEPLVIEDTADSWGAGHGSYRKVVGRFKPAARPAVVEQGPIRTITRSVLIFGKSRVVMDVVAYPAWPVLEFRFRVIWNEERRRLKLALPTAFPEPSLLVEVPGGAIERPADGEEHVHGRWLVIENRSRGTAPSGHSPLSRRRSRTLPDSPAAIGVASSGQHGLDFKDGELRLSVLRSSAYCHERGFELGTRPQWKFADIGVHEFRLLVTAGAPAAVKAMMPGLADHLAAPPAAYAHLPYDTKQAAPIETLLRVKPANVRLLACKRSWDGEALIVRLQEAVGNKTKAELRVAEWRGHAPTGHVPLVFAPFEIKTLRVEKDGRAVPVRMIEEDLP